MTEEKFSFEQAFEKLEKILDKMNEGSLSLDEALKFFEEGDKLIGLCDNYLSSAQQKIETLIKNRDGKLDLDEKEMPKKEEYTPPSQKVLQEDTKKV